MNENTDELILLSEIEEPILSPVELLEFIDDTNPNQDGESVLNEPVEALASIVEPRVYESLHNMYAPLIAKAKEGYISGYTHADIMQILRYCEKKTGKELPINTTCAPCVIDLVLLFDRLR